MTKVTGERRQIYEDGLVFYATNQGAMMAYLSASFSCDDAMKQADLVLDGYTVSSQGRCMARVGAEFVMRDGADHCVRVPAANTDALVLGAMWADFNHPATGMQDTADTSEPSSCGPVLPKDASLVLQGYTTNTRGVCLARIVGHYIARDGVRRYVRFLVDTVDPVRLGAAWAAFSDAAGWVRVVSGVRVERLEQA